MKKAVFILSLISTVSIVGTGIVSLISYIKDRRRII